MEMSGGIMSQLYPFGIVNYLRNPLRIILNKIENTISIVHSGGIPVIDPNWTRVNTINKVTHIVYSDLLYFLTGITIRLANFPIGNKCPFDRHFVHIVNHHTYVITNSHKSLLCFFKAFLPSLCYFCDSSPYYVGCKLFYDYPFYICAWYSILR